jgi:hypothetical protein
MEFLILEIFEYLWFSSLVLHFFLFYNRNNFFRRKLKSMEKLVILEMFTSNVSKVKPQLLPKNRSLSTLKRIIFKGGGGGRGEK